MACFKFVSQRAVGALLATALCARHATAQLTVQARQTLAFGVTLPGVARSVVPSNALSAGQFYLVEHKGGVVRLALTLPATLARAGGGTLSITYATTDGEFVTTGVGATTTVFNPKSTKNVTLTSSADGYVHVGGTIRPTAGQATGTYTGTITLTVTIIS